ncbi:GNAT family N-acetyltransferase [Pigmentiphaga sp.]|uniref:GNAT family N-acetyltransferase n=1 Tax=Pigmentiphaga sp. TaxID=1977564 RepID=UPI0025D6757C|nr:GNAT family N-acetyltransferase [Pigmentiphaga sp.]
MVSRHAAGFVVEAMRPADVEGVLAVQRQAYAGIDVLENAAFFLNRIHLAPGSCWVARGADGIWGYLVSYPWSLDAPPKLNVPLAGLPADARNWFLHDCAVLPAASGKGIGTALVRTGIAHAERAGFAWATLVSLAPACGYWMRLGFEPVQLEPGALRDYGPGARFMRRPLAAGA